MAGLLKRVVSVVFVAMFLYAPAFAAPPANPDIPADLLKEKLLKTYVNQMFQRAKYWRGDLCAATSIDTVLSIREEIVKDYNLYNAPNYQNEYAKISEALYLPVLRGEKIDLIKADDPLATVKLIHIALAISAMSPAYMDRGFEEMLANQNQAIRYLGWQGMKKNRSAEMTVAQLKTLYTAAQATLAKETNPNIVCEVLQAIDFGTAATQTVPDKLRKAAAGKTAEIVLQNWNKFVNNVPTADSGDKLLLPEVAAVTLANNVAFAGNDKQKAQAVQLIFAQAHAALTRFEKLQASIKALKSKLDKLKVKSEKTNPNNPNVVMPAEAGQQKTEALPLTPEQQKLTLQMAELETIAGDYKVFLMNCEEAFNALAGASNTFIALQMTNTADPASAMKMGLLDWKAALKLDAK